MNEDIVDKIKHGFLVGSMAIILGYGLNKAAKYNRPYKSELISDNIERVIKQNSNVHFENETLKNTELKNKFNNNYLDSLKYNIPKFKELSNDSNNITYVLKK